MNLNEFHLRVEEGAYDWSWDTDTMNHLKAWDEVQAHLFEEGVHIDHARKGVEFDDFYQGWVNSSPWVCYPDEDEGWCFQIITQEEYESDWN